MDSGSAITLFNSPGGSTLQSGAELFVYCLKA